MKLQRAVQNNDLEHGIMIGMSIVALWVAWLV